MEATDHRHDISDKEWTLLEILIDEPDYEWLMIDASHIKVHPLFCPETLERYCHSLCKNLGCLY